jgi:uncharacterized OsmC-like protein
MSSLLEFLTQKRAAFLNRRARIVDGRLGPSRLKASATAEGRSGVRRIRIRDFQTISDSPPDFAGYDLGPSSPELQLGVLASCLNHSFLIQAAALEIPIESIAVDVEATLDPRARGKGFETVPVYPYDISYVVRLESSASADEIERLRIVVEESCPILNLLKNPQRIAGGIEHVQPGVGAPASERAQAAE